MREEGSGGIHKAAARLMPCSNQPCSTRGVRLAGEKVEYGLFSHMVNSRRMRYWGFVSVLLLAQLHCSAHPPTPVHLPASLRAQVQARYTKGRPHAHVPRRSTCFYTVLPLATPATLPPCHLATLPPRHPLPLSYRPLDAAAYGWSEEGEDNTVCPACLNPALLLRMQPLCLHAYIVQRH